MAMLPTGVQLSVAVAEPVPVGVLSSSQSIVTLAGQVIVGFSSSMTVTVWLQFAVRPLPSVTIQLTVVMPIGNAYVAGSIVTPPTCATTPATLQLSAVAGVPSVAVVVQFPAPSAEVVVIILAGHTIVGFSLSVTVTVWLQLAVRPLPSVTIQLTVVNPIGKAYVAGSIVTPPICAITPATLQL